jgi:hypothetical protein
MNRLLLSLHSYCLCVCEGVSERVSDLVRMVSECVSSVPLQEDSVSCYYFDSTIFCTHAVFHHSNQLLLLETRIEYDPSCVKMKLKIHSLSLSLSLSLGKERETEILHKTVHYTLLSALYTIRSKQLDA